MTVGRVSKFAHTRAGKAQGKGMHHYAEGGMARHDDAAADRKMINAAMKKEEADDKRMIKRAVSQHETQEHGGKHSKIALACGGKVRKYADGGYVDDDTSQTARDVKNQRDDMENQRTISKVFGVKNPYEDPEGAPSPSNRKEWRKRFDKKFAEQIETRDPRKYEQIYGRPLGELVEQRATGGHVKKYATGGAVKPPVRRGRSVPVAPPPPLMGPLQSAMSDNYGNNMKRRMPRA